LQTHFRTFDTGFICASAIRYYIISPILDVDIQEIFIFVTSGAWDGTVREHENRSDGVDVPLDLSRSAPLVELVLPKTASVGQPRRVEDANQRPPLLTTLKMLVLTTVPFLLVSV
jgi:hypothetical protein